MQAQTPQPLHWKLLRPIFLRTITPACYILPSACCLLPATCYLLPDFCCLLYQFCELCMRLPVPLKLFSPDIFRNPLAHNVHISVRFNIATLPSTTFLHFYDIYITAVALPDSLPRHRHSLGMPKDN
jgi:hypothetical protein